MKRQLKIPLNKRAWPPGIKDQTYKMLKGKNVTFLVAERAYRRWREDGRAELCKYGKEPPPDCNCGGCIEKLLFLLYDWVTLQFASLPGDPANPMTAPPV